ncbi:uncharacterized protein LOC131944705 [Physella acuta]|uniref:uncharacterized protein LOC131944705 n=1 Tax=Physella acuta TaxID=109671 RepID=UPI0027DD43F6|nr:uncharacterized protein LOC131944705 [Physella acuta]
MQVYTDNSKIMADTSNRIDKLELKHSVVYKLLEQRLMPFDKMIQMVNQRFEDREQHLKKLEVIESEIKRLSRDIHTIDTRDCNRYACHIQLKGDTAVSRGSIVSRFGDVREYNSQNFNQTTGTFVSPHDGLYLVCVTLHEWEDKLIRVGIWARDMWYNVIEVKSAHTSAAGSVVVDMKKGQELYFYVDGADQDAKLSCFSSFAIVSLFK